MKRLIKYILPLMLLILAPSPQVKAQGDAAALAPLLETWQGLQMSKFAQQARAMIDELNTAMSQLENTKNMYNTVEKAYNIASTFTTGGEEIYGVYKECEILYKRSIYTYNYVQTMLANGKISLSDASYIMGMVEYFDSFGLKTVKDIRDIIFNKDLTFEFKLKRIREALMKLRSASKILADTVQEVEEEQEAVEEYEAVKHWFKTTYGIDVDKTNSIAKSYEQAKKDVKAAQTQLSGGKSTNTNPDVPVTVNQKEVKEKGNQINELGIKIMNWITMIVGLLFVIMAVPAYFRRNQGHQQSQDAIMKLFRGTLIIIIVIQVMGRILFSID